MTNQLYCTFGIHHWELAGTLVRPLRNFDSVIECYKCKTCSKERITLKPSLDNQIDELLDDIDVELEKGPGGTI